MIILFLIAGSIIGGLLLEEGGVLPGAVLGYLLFREIESRKTVDALKGQVELLKESLRRKTQETVETREATAPEEAPLTSSPEPLEVVPEPVGPEPEPAEEPPLFEEVGPIPDAESLFEPAPTAESQAASTPKSPFEESKRQPEDDILEEWFNRAKEFVLGGNLIARIGVGILFVGLSFLIKLAIENSLFPIELRLASAGLVGVGMIAGGWRIAQSRPGYGVSLQGGGIAILFLTVFASFRLYSLIPSQPAFFLLVAITLFGSFVAIRQNAQSLAVLSFLGGFLAPIITSTGSGNHVALFTYYAVLNAGILFMSWNKPWRLLHLTGFLFTFGVAALWGADAYRPELFATTEPFLIIFFLIFVAIGLIYTIRHEATTNRYLDSSLIFGLPVVVFTLQAVLAEPYEFGLAWSSLVLGAFYSVLAWILYRRNPGQLRLMVESFSGIGLALISMTIPFALNATWTGTGWALEGAALIWLGIQQKRILLRAGGVLLIVAAAVSFVMGLEDTSYTIRNAYRFLANPAYMGFLALSLANLFGAYQIQKHRDELRFSGEYYAGVFLLIAGVAWWLIGGLVEIEREFSSRYSANIMIVFVSLSAAGFALVGRRLAWPSFMRGALYLPFVLYLLIVVSGLQNNHLFEDYGWIAWGIAIPALVFVLKLLEENMSKRLAAIAHVASVWLLTIVLLSEIYHIFDRWTPAGSVWPIIGYFLAPVIMLLLIVYGSNRSLWPVSTHQTAYLKFASIPLLAGLWLGSMYTSFNIAGDPTPLPYVPLLNPLDVLVGFLVMAGVYWYQSTSRRDPDFFGETGRQFLSWSLILTAFIWLNATIGRTVHHWIGVPYSESLLNVSAFQTALSVCWTLLAVTVMAFAARRNARTPWLAAAALLALVVIKLFVVDLSSLTTLHRVISFIAVGLLLLLIGYVAPVPPRKPAVEGGTTA